MAAEVAATLLSLRLGVLAPRCRIVSTASEEGTCVQAILGARGTHACECCAGVAMLSAFKKLDPSWHVVTCLFDQSHVLLKVPRPPVHRTLSAVLNRLRLRSGV
jgi:hypothetical protein